MASKPASVPRWANVGGDIVEPTSGKKDVGWAAAERPPNSYMNWLQNLAYQWLLYLNDGALSGNHSITGTFNVTGAVDLDSTLNVNGAVDLDTTLNVNGAVDLDSTLLVNGAADFDSTVNVDGIATFQVAPVAKAGLKFEETGAGTESVLITAPSSITGDKTYTLPGHDITWPAAAPAKKSKGTLITTAGVMSYRLTDKIVQSLHAAAGAWTLDSNSGLWSTSTDGVGFAIGLQGLKQGYRIRNVDVDVLSAVGSTLQFRLYSFENGTGSQIGSSVNSTSGVEALQLSLVGAEHAVEAYKSYILQFSSTGGGAGTRTVYDVTVEVDFDGTFPS